MFIIEQRFVRKWTLIYWL